MEEEEVIHCLEVYLRKLGAKFKRRKTGPDFTFEDGSAIEAKGSEWLDVGEVLKQLADYYMTSPSMGFAIPADTLNIDRAYRLMLLEKALMYSEHQGQPITVYCVTKVEEKSYRLLRYDSVEKLFGQVTDELGRIVGVDWWLEPNERIKHIGGHLKKESNELFKMQIIQIVSNRGSEVTT